jgi:hypothetical protein
MHAAISTSSIIPQRSRPPAEPSDSIEKDGSSEFVEKVLEKVIYVRRILHKRLRGSPNVLDTKSGSQTAAIISYHIDLIDPPGCLGSLEVIRGPRSEKTGRELEPVFVWPKLGEKVRVQL